MSGKLKVRPSKRPPEVDERPTRAGEPARPLACGTSFGLPPSHHVTDSHASSRPRRQTEACRSARFRSVLSPLRPRNPVGWCSTLGDDLSKDNTSIWPAPWHSCPTAPSRREAPTPPYLVAPSPSRSCDSRAASRPEAAGGRPPFRSRLLSGGHPRPALPVPFRCRHPPVWHRYTVNSSLRPPRRPEAPARRLVRYHRPSCSSFGQPRRVGRFGRRPLNARGALGAVSLVSPRKVS